MADKDDGSGDLDNDVDTKEGSEGENFTPEDFKKLKEEHERTKQYLAKANKEAKERRIALKSLEDAGLTVEQALALQKKIEEDDHVQAQKRGDVEKIREQLQGKYEKEIKERDEKLSKMKASLYENLVSSKAADALNSLGAVKGAGKVLMPHIQKHANVIEEDGKYVVRIVDEDGDTKFTDGGEYMDIQGYLKEMQVDEVFGHLFVQTSHSGGGSKSGGKAGGGAKKYTKSTITKEEKMELIKKEGYAAYKKLPD